MSKTAKFKILVDMFLCTVSYAIPTLALTFVIQPYMSKIVSGDVYGLFLTEISIVRLCVGILSSSLAGLRLLVNEQYKEKKLTGDFNLLLFIAIVIANIITAMIVNFFEPGKSFVDIILVMIVITLIMLHDYYSIYYRITLDYVKLTIDTTLCTIGFFIGLLLYIKNGKWQVVFIAGYLLALVYVLLTTSLWKEPLKRTPIFKATYGKYRNLAVSNALTDSVNYCDKLIMYPILGGYMVSVYNAATVMGKAIQLLTVPIQRVILSYLVKKQELKRKHTFRIIILCGALFLCAYIALLFLSHIIIPIMYPEFYNDVKAFVWIVLLAIIINALANFYNIIVIRFKNTNFQMILSAVQLCSYAIIAFALIGKMNLMAICVASLVSSVLKLLLVLVTLLRSPTLAGTSAK